MTLGEVATVLNTTVEGGGPGVPIGGFSIDSRTIGRGDLFFAIEGARFDGHAFARAAVAAGAVGLVLARGKSVEDLPPGAAVLRVADTTRALQLVARHVRRLSGATVVAITGSAGKTTTKEIAAEFLSLRFRTYRSRGNLNNHIGLPLSLLELRSRPEMAVMELGMNHAGEIRQLVGICEPNVRVWTNVGEAHIGHFDSVEAVADAKAEILEGATAESHLVANGDDPLVMARVDRFRGRLTTFGFDSAVTFRAGDVRLCGVRGSEAIVSTPVGRFPLTLALLGRANLGNALAAMAVAHVCGVPIADVAAAAPGLRPAPHRGEVLVLGEVTVIDDSYNSNPPALAQSLEALASETGARRRVAVVGEMGELGSSSVELHERCGALAATSGLGLLVTVGGDGARRLGARAVAGGLAADEVVHADSAAAAADLAADLVRPGDVVLVKGSRSVGLERVVERLGRRPA